MIAYLWTGPSFSVLGADNFGQKTLGLQLSAGSARDFQVGKTSRPGRSFASALDEAGDVIWGEVELLLYPKSESVLLPVLVWLESTAEMGVGM